MGTVQGRLLTQLLEAPPRKHKHSLESMPNIEIMRVIVVMTFWDTCSFPSINILILKYKFWLVLWVVADKCPQPLSVQLHTGTLTCCVHSIITSSDAEYGTGFLTFTLSRCRLTVSRKEAILHWNSIFFFLLYKLLFLRLISVITTTALNSDMLQPCGLKTNKSPQTSNSVQIWLHRI